MTDVCMKMCSGPIVWLSAHLHGHVRHTGHCTFTCTWCVHANVHWSDCPVCSCKWGVSRVTEIFMEMWSEPSVWLTAHLHAHVRYSGHCTFTCTWCVHINVQWSDCLMCPMIGQWAQWLMCAWKCAVEPIVLLSAHLHAHVRHTGHCIFTCTWCVHVNVKLSDCPMCSCNWVVRCGMASVNMAWPQWMWYSVTVCDIASIFVGWP